MDETKLIDIRRKLLREEDVKMRQRKPRQQSTDGLSGKTQQKQTTPLEVGIKEMPMFDPDMEFRGLALTIPTWMNASHEPGQRQISIWCPNRPRRSLL